MIILRKAYHWAKFRKSTALRTRIKSSIYLMYPVECTKITRWMQNICIKICHENKVTKNIRFEFQQNDPFSEIAAWSSYGPGQARTLVPEQFWSRTWKAFTLLSIIILGEVFSFMVIYRINYKYNLYDPYEASTCNQVIIKIDLTFSSSLTCFNLNRN